MAQSPKPSVQKAADEEMHASAIVPIARAVTEGKHAATPFARTNG